jgi:hypothetical protein
MIIYGEQKVVEKVVTKITCDRCKKEIEGDLEQQEMHNIRFTGGYGSVFGDMNEIDCDLCQYCLFDLIGDFCIYNGSET